MDERVRIFHNPGFIGRSSGIVRLKDPFEAEDLLRKRTRLLYLLQFWLWHWCFLLNLVNWRRQNGAKLEPSQKKLNRIKWKTCCDVGFNPFVIRKGF